MAALAGKLLDKKGARLPIIIGVIASLTSLILMNILAPLNSIAIVLLYVLYYGGYGMCFGSLMTSGLITLSKANHAQGNAIFNTLQQFSGALGTALAGTLIAIAQNNHVGNGTAIGSKWTFMVLLVLAGLLLLIAFLVSNFWLTLGVVGLVYIVTVPMTGWIFLKVRARYERDHCPSALDGVATKV